MNLDSLITVGLPIYNAMPYLPEAMDSLLSQDCPRFEILAIVDGSTDSSLEYLRSLAAQPSIARRLRILVQQNCGLAPTLNRMLRECRTPWLIRQDADDVSHPRRIGRLLAAIQAAPHAGMFYSLANYHPRGRAVGAFRCTRGTPQQLRAIVRGGYLLSICHPTVALNVEKTLALGGYRIGLHNEDADLWWRMALEHDIHFLPEQLVGFRQNHSSVSARNLSAQMLAGLYVQYLLISHLNSYAPRPFSHVQPHLQALLSTSALRSKERLREFNMCLARKSYLRAAASFFASALASPGHLCGRIRDELAPSRRPVTNGIRPQLFLDRREALWL